MGKEALNFILITIGIFIITLMMAGKILEGVAVFTYFFVKGSSEAVSDGLSELITVSAGVPGSVEIIYLKPATKFFYTALFGRRMVFIDAEQGATSLPLGFNQEELENLFKKTSSSSGVDFTAPDKIENFFDVKIRKEYSINKLKVEIIE